MTVQEPLSVWGGYWLPAGWVEPGENLTDSGVRETLVIAMIHYLKNKVGVVDFANAQGVVMF